jgi:hypothetical protein
MGLKKKKKRKKNRERERERETKKEKRSGDMSSATWIRTIQPLFPPAAYIIRRKRCIVLSFSS